MANLSTARTRLGLFGYATRPTGSFDRTTAPVAPVDKAFAALSDAVVTLFAAIDALVIGVALNDGTVTRSLADAGSSASDAPVTNLTLTDEIVGGAVASDI